MASAILAAKNDFSFATHMSFWSERHGSLRPSIFHISPLKTSDLVRVSRKSKQQRRWGQTAEAATEYKQTQHGGASRMTYLPKVFFGIPNIFRIFFFECWHFNPNLTFSCPSYKRLWKLSFDEFDAESFTVVDTERAQRVEDPAVLALLQSAWAQAEPEMSAALQRCWKIECESFHVFMIFHCSSQPRRTWIYCRRSSIFLKWFEQA